MKVEDFVLRSVLLSSICCTFFLNPTFVQVPSIHHTFFPYIQLFVVLFVQVRSIHHTFFVSSTLNEPSEFRTHHAKLAENKEPLHFLF